ncbi:MAG: hypothetical protein QNK37_35190 [Acidobacteriota bacterium]|nr:hypothetical protein [Acidobacteriota bacterium]
MLILAMAYGLYVAFHFESYRPLLQRVGHGTVFLLIGILGFTSGDRPIDWVAVSAPALLFFQTYVINAFYDAREDQLNDRVLLLEPVHLTVTYGFVLQTIIWGFEHHARLGLILTALWLITEAYHNPLIRLKRCGLAQSLLEGAAAALCFSLGSNSVTSALIVGGFFGVASNLKDLDDHFGDHHVGNRTFLVTLILRVGTGVAVLCYKITFLFAGAMALSLAFMHYQTIADGAALLGLAVVSVSYASAVCFGLHGERKFLVANGLILGLLPALSALL